MNIQLENLYELKCNLGTIKEIENVFKKSFNKIVSNLDNLTASELIELIYIGAKKADSNINKQKFIEECEENLGVAELNNIIEEFILQLQYPGKTAEEIQKKIAERLAKINTVQTSIGSQS